MLMRSVLMASLLSVTAPVLASWVTTDVDARPSVRSPSLAFRSSGLAGVAYGGTGLSYAEWDGAAWLIELVDMSDCRILGVSLDYDAADEPVIAYFDYTSGELELARFSRPVSTLAESGSLATTIGNEGTRARLATASEAESEERVRVGDSSPVFGRMSDNKKL